MANNFNTVLPLVLAHEGGFSNHPRDPGGATMRGVTQRVYDSYRANRNLSKQSVRYISDAELRDIYKNQYWDMCNADDLPAGLDYAVFDYAVNSGPNRAVKDLQRTVGAKVDGQVGEETRRKAREAANVDEVGLIERYCRRRMSFLHTLSTWGDFGKGWTRRVMGDFDGYQQGDRGVIDYAAALAIKDLEFPIPAPQLPTAVGQKEGEENGKGEESTVALTKTSEGIGAIIAATGVTGQTVIATAQQVQPHIGDTFLGRAALVVFLVLILAGSGLYLWTLHRKLKEAGVLT